MPRTSRKPPRPKPPPTGVLDWSSNKHWMGGESLPCRYCRRPTWLKDNSRKPAHKVCAEEAFRRLAADAAEAYENERLRLG